MKVSQFLEHHGIAQNPFADEDAQTDLVFKGYCITHTYHPTWDKIYGDPAEPATSIVFGEKGSGKTALGLQVVRHLADYNARHADQQVLVVRYDDFNPYLDRFRERFSGRARRIDRVLAQWKLWDHMDAILALGVTQLVDRILRLPHAQHPAAADDKPLPLAGLDASQRRDLLLLAAGYDQSTAENVELRWNRLRRSLRVSAWRSKLDLALGLVVTGLTLGVVAGLHHWHWLTTPWPYLPIAAAWLPRLGHTLKGYFLARRIIRNTRTLDHNVHLLRRVLMRFRSRQIVAQPLPLHPRTDDRYALLAKFQTVLRTLGLGGIVVLVDRVDEPYLINGSADLMRALVWPLLDNKFLKHPGLGLKLLLPAELVGFIDRESREFYERARLDKQNLVRSLNWTGASLYDVANARLQACATGTAVPSLEKLFDGAIDAHRLQDAFASLRVPRHLFKFMYRVVTAHCNAHTDEQPVWQIGEATFQASLALYQREQDAFDRGAGAV
jgi:hypothetical protein